MSNSKNDTSKNKTRLTESSGNVTLEEIASKNKIVGTCTNLEKQFFRLGADPDPAKVRPEHILKQSLKMLKKKWKHKEVEYRYMEEQFKSIRQDLVVQGIK
jgi:SAC3 family protein LENG8/THP3